MKVDMNEGDVEHHGFLCSRMPKWLVLILLATLLMPFVYDVVTIREHWAHATPQWVGDDLLAVMESHQAKNVINVFIGLAVRELADDGEITEVVMPEALSNLRPTYKNYIGDDIQAISYGTIRQMVMDRLTIMDYDPQLNEEYLELLRQDGEFEHFSEEVYLYRPRSIAPGTSFIVHSDKDRSKIFILPTAYSPYGVSL